MKIFQKNFNNFESFSQESHIVALIEELKKIDYDFTEGSRTFRDMFLDKIMRLGYTNRLAIGELTNITITSYCRGTGICLQLGNIARAFYDLLKLQSMFKLEKIKNAILICPDLPNGNRAYFSRIEKELSDIYQPVVEVPLLLISIDKE